MASIQTGIQLNDQFSSVINNMVNAVSMFTASIQDMQQTMNTNADTGAFDSIRDEINQATAAAEELNREINNIDPSEPTRQQEKFNETVQQGTNSANELSDAIGKVGAAIGSMFAIQKVVGFINDCTDATNTQLNAQRQLEGQIAAWYQRFADNNGMSLADARRMLTTKELSEFKWDINQYIQYGQENAVNGQWVKELENASARYHIARLEALKLQTQQQIEALFGNQLDSIDSAMRNIYTSGYYHTAYEIQKGVGVAWDFATLDDKQISKVINKPWAADGKHFSERIWGNRQKLVGELNQTLTRNIMLGKDPQKAIDEIARKMNTSKNVAGRLVMTEEAFFSSAAQKDCFAELDVEQFEIVATLDSHTSEICQEMDGKHFPMSQWEVGVTAPPFHVYCRSTTVPYFDDEFDNIGERAARDEEGNTYYVPADMTYKEWEKSFVDGDKTGLKEINPVEKSENMGYYKRTEEELTTIADNVKGKVTDYSLTKSKWSGKININNSLADNGVSGQKEWNCDISLIDTADDGIIWHEMLHSCSASHFPENVYAENQFIEEASVEFLTQQICEEQGILYEGAYLNIVSILKVINDSFGYGSDLEFAKELFNVPLSNRYEWLENKVVNSMEAENVTFEDFNDVLLFIRQLQGGE